MMYNINITPENHGYTIRLVKCTLKNVGEGKNIKTVETISTVAILLIHHDKQTAIASFEALNTFIAVAVQENIIPEGTLRYMPLKRYS